VGLVLSNVSDEYLCVIWSKILTGNEIMYLWRLKTPSNASDQQRFSIRPDACRHEFVSHGKAINLAIHFKFLLKHGRKSAEIDGECHNKIAGIEIERTSNAAVEYAGIRDGGIRVLFKDRRKWIPSTRIWLDDPLEGVIEKVLPSTLRHQSHRPLGNLHEHRIRVL